jgi:HD-GYP domain-containing protein (c-di-GMP phosphodiesterase class II)
MEEVKKPQKKVATPGERLLHNMFRLLQVVKIHQANNKLFEENVKLFSQVLAEVWSSTSTVQFTLYRGRFYLNDERIVYTPTMWATSAKMAEYFQQRGINELKFIDKGPLTQEQIVGFMGVFNRAVKESDPADWLETTLSESFPWVQINKASDKDLFSEGQAGEDAAAGRSQIIRSSTSKSSPAFAKQAYSQALTALRTLTERLNSGKTAGVQKSKRAIETLIDLLFDDEITFLALATIRDDEDLLYTHSVNVAILAMCIGKHLGMGSSALEQLGLSGLFLDLGKSGQPKSVINKSQRLTGDELQLARDHSLLSVLDIIRLNASHGLKHSIIAAAGEHHMCIDHSGYPQVGNPELPLSLYGRILAIADQYDALTSTRPWREPIPPHDALVMLMKDAGSKLDPLILKVLVSILGAFPPGSILFLDTHEAAISQYTPSALVGARPVARLLNIDNEGFISGGDVIDLVDTNPTTGEYLRNIISSAHPSALSIQAVNFLLPDDMPEARRNM